MGALGRNTQELVNQLAHKESKEAPLTGRHRACWSPEQGTQPRPLESLSCAWEAPPDSPRQTEFNRSFLIGISQEFYIIL